MVLDHFFMDAYGLFVLRIYDMHDVQISSTREGILFDFSYQMNGFILRECRCKISFASLNSSKFDPILLNPDFQMSRSILPHLLYLCDYSILYEEDRFRISLPIRTEE